MTEGRKKILIAIPTHKRPEGLSSALKSLENIAQPDSVDIEVLVVENDQHKTSEDVIADFTRFPVYYMLEKNLGLVYVRNRILEEAVRLDADYIAGLDDDEVATENWLTSLWGGLKKYNATVATGPALSQFEIKPPPWIIKGNFFKTQSTRKSGRLLQRAGIGNHLLDMSFIAKQPIRFDLRFNFLGSEDTDFFGRMCANGGSIVWIQEAVVYESVPVERMRLGYLLKRDYRIGQGRAARYRKKSSARGVLLGILGLMTAILYTIILPFHWTRASFYKRLCKIVKQFGVFVGIFRTDFKAYGTTSGK